MKINLQQGRTFSGNANKSFKAGNYILLQGRPNHLPDATALASHLKKLGEKFMKHADGGVLIIENPISLHPHLLHVFQSQ